MLDIKFVRENLKQVKEKLKDRMKDLSIIDKVIDIDKCRIQALQKLEKLQQDMNKASKDMADLKKQDKEKEFKQKTIELKGLSEKIKKQNLILKDISNSLKQTILVIPNLSLNNDLKENKIKKVIGKLPKFEFKVKDHLELGESLGILDMRRAAKIAGANFPLLIGFGAELERALINFMLDIQKKNGYTEIVPPMLVNSNSLIGTGQLPKFEEDLFKCEKNDFYLVPTAEVPLMNIRRDEVLNIDELPLKYMAYTPCFRREAGSYGKENRGLIRNHQFNKVEIVKIVEPNKSNDELESLTKDACTVLDLLGLHYRIVELCPKDLGFAAAKTYDIEVWMPFLEKFVEISSCSNCLDFQSRRLNLRYKDGDKGMKSLKHLDTLNGSGLAVGRLVAAICENFQTKDGKIELPKILKEYIK